MEKISGILPANSRITSVDIKKGGTARSGTPNFGRDVGLSSPDRRALAKSIGGDAMSRHQELMDARHNSEKQVKIIERLNNDFFNKKTVEPDVSKEMEYLNSKDTDMVIEQPSSDIQGPSANSSPLEVDSARENSLQQSLGLNHMNGSSSSKEDSEDKLISGQYLDVTV